MPFAPILLNAAVATGTVGLLTTATVLGIRHGIDWDHIAAITDITSTSAAADAATTAHEADHGGPGHAHKPATQHPDAGAAPVADPSGGHETHVALVAEQRRAMFLGTLYALGHALVVALLGLAALAFGAVLPDWVDPIMGRVVGATLLLLGIWVFVSLYQYARHGKAFRLRSRWMLVFDTIRYAWRGFQARLHGHEHVAPLEMSSYGPRTAFAVGMIHGIGAETGTQVLLIAAIGGATGAGLGIPMMIAFICGLLVSNSAIVLLTSAGFVASQLREKVYVVIGAVAGTFSVVVGLIFLLAQNDNLPDLGHLFG